MTARAGTSLAELVLVAWLFAFVLAAVARFAVVQGRISALQHDRVRAAEAVRTASVVLEGEFRSLVPGDFARTTDEVVRIRAIRGGGGVCRTEGSSLLVRYRGARLPNPSKDSLLLLSGVRPERETRLALTAVAGDTGCGGSLRLAVSPAPPTSHGLALVYESGSYHLSGGALRYRLGAGGRQPLTEALLAAGAFDYRASAGGGAGGLALRLELDADSTPRVGAIQLDLPLHALNGPFPP